MIVTDRDKKVLEFLEEFKIANTDTIQELFYPSLRVAQRRLKLLYDNKLVKRDRDTFTSQYYYYIRKPKQLRHSLILTNFYRELNKIAKIEMFKCEFTIGGIRADGFVAYEYKNKKQIAFVEVQIANTALDIKKYEELYKSSEYKKYFPVFPLIIAITDKKMPKTRINIIQTREDLSNLKEVYNHINSIRIQENIPATNR